MKLGTLIEVLKLDVLNINNDAHKKDYEYFFASNMMSNVLVMINDNYQSTILLTGLVNVQSLITAEMLDVNTIIYLTDKTFDSNVIEVARSKKINIFKTNKTFEDITEELLRNGIEEIK